jgi:hypothetical protein
MKLNWSKLLPHIVAVGAFIILSLAYCRPLLDGEVLKQGDIVVHRGMSKDIADHREQFGEEPLWLASAFSGMPAFTVSVKYPSNLVDKIQQAYNRVMPHPVRFIFLLAFGFYILLLSLRIDPWLSIAGAVAFAFSSNFLVSIEAGHNSKVLAIAYMPAVIGASILAFNGRWILGGVLATFFGSLLINAGHFQIIYYTAIVMLLVGMIYVVKGIREGTWKDLWKPSLVLLMAAGISAAPNYSRLHNVNAHTPETMRGGQSELTAKQGGAGGLDIDYALGDWSYGIDEPMTLMFPFYEAGASNEIVGANSKSVEAINRYARVEELGVPLYRGPQRFHSPIYIGASVFFLFFLGIFIIKGYNRWWIYTAALLSVALALGNNFHAFNGFLFDHMPLFNKFRTPTMALCIIGIMVPLLGMMAVNKLFHHDKDPEASKSFKRAVILTSLFVGIALIVGLTSDFSAPNDVITDSSGRTQIVIAEQYSSQLFGNDAAAATQKRAFEESFLEGVRSDRRALYMKGLVRSLAFFALAGALIFLFIKGKIKRPFLIGGLAALMLVDVWALSRRYFNDDNFEPKADYERNFEPPPSSQQVMRDQSLHYRVLRYGPGMFSDGLTSYWHKNILGNSSAKVQLYQDLIQVNDSINGVLGDEINKIPALLNQYREKPEMVEVMMGPELPVLNMLNMKYVILGPNAGQVIPNELNALGNAWFVRLIEFVPDADAEYAVLRRGNFAPEYTAVVQEKYRRRPESPPDGPFVNQQTYYIDSANIRLTSYKSNHLVYESTNGHPGFAVFSEIYYKNGWHCYIDGKEVPIIKVNYALRGVDVPPGNHKIEMKFEPASYPEGERRGSMGSALWAVMILGGIGWLGWKNRKRLAASAQ